MKTNIYTSLLAILLLLTFFSCKDYLDIKPKGQMIPTSTDDYRKILDYIGNKNSVGFRIDLLNTYGITEYLSDNYQPNEARYATLKTDQINRFNWAKNGFLYDVDKEDLDWRSLYGQIYIANSAIAGIPDATGSEDIKKSMIGEAKVHRAFCYLGLVNIYAKHYTEASAATDLGVPLKLDVSLSSSLERVTVKEVYDQIIKDLTEAIPDLSSEQKYNLRPTKASAYGLLARTYLFQGNYEKALENAQACLNISDFLYDLHDMMNHDDPANLRYNKFDSDFTSWDDQEILLQKEVPSGSTGGGYYYSWYFWTDSLTLDAIYIDMDNDLRLPLKFNKVSNTDYQYYEVRNRWAGETFYYAVHGVSTPEVLLTRAEANARLGNPNLAIADLDALRVNRFIHGTYSNYSDNSYTQNEVIQLVLDERRRELFGRNMRWFDLKRLNAIENANITITRVLTGNQLAPGDNHWVMPIGMKYIGLNQEIVQNEGYD
jgi:hypothetical protein